MDSITISKGCSHWAFVQVNMFPSQGSDFDKVFLFKMLEVGPSNGVDLVYDLVMAFRMLGLCLTM
jgi:hypothetical protein